MKKYDSISEEIERKSLTDLKDREVYNFHRIEKVQKDANCGTRSDIKSDTKQKKTKGYFRNR